MAVGRIWIAVCALRRVVQAGFHGCTLSKRSRTSSISAEEASQMNFFKVTDSYRR